MSVGFKSRDDLGNLMVDSEFICYGLFASGYLTYLDTWGRWQLRSNQLDPNDPSSYSLTSGMDVIYKISVVGALRPIVFINGSGMYVGSSKDGTVTTFYFTLATPGTKAYVFDIMRDLGTSVGFKTYADNATNDCTFNSAFVPLNIVHSMLIPAPVLNSAGTYGVPVAGSAKSWLKPNSTNPVFNLVCRLSVTIGSGNYATCTTFSRSMAGGRQTGIGSPGGVAPGYTSYQGYTDGAHGTAGGMDILVTDAPRTQMIPASTAAGNSFVGIPVDRLPMCLSVNIDTLPFPFAVS